MGIDGFGAFLKKFAPRAFAQVSPATFLGKRLAFDCTLKLYTLFFRNQGHEGAALKDLASFVRTLDDMHIQAVFVLDGHTRGLKPRAHEERAAASVRAKEGVQRAEAALLKPITCTADLFTRATEVKRARLRAAQPSPSFFVKCQDVLARGTGTVVRAEDDAERHIAGLVATGSVDYAVSKDYDTLVFGAPHLVLDFPVAGDATVVTLATALEDLRLPNREALVDLAIMAGCDFTPKLPKVGPVTAWKAILAHGTIEKAQEARAVPIGPEGFDPDFARARFFGREVVPKPATEAATAPEGAGAAQDAEDAAAPDPSKEEV